jgi:hypothetical protein
MWTGIVLWCALSNGVVVACEAKANEMELYPSEIACYKEINALLRHPEIVEQSQRSNNPIVLKEANCVEWKTELKTSL